MWISKRISGTEWIFSIKEASEERHASYAALEDSRLRGWLSCSFENVPCRSRLMLPLENVKEALTSARRPCLLRIGGKFVSGDDSGGETPIEWIALVRGTSPIATEFWHRLETKPPVTALDRLRTWQVTASNIETDDFGDLFLCIQFLPHARKCLIGNVFVTVDKPTAAPRPPAPPKLQPVASTPAAAPPRPAPKPAAKPEPGRSAPIKFPTKPGSVVCKLEQATRSLIKGWAAVVGAPDEVVEIDVVINGQTFSRLRAERTRGDLVRAGVSHSGGFELPLLAPISHGGEDVVEIRATNTGHLVAGPIVLAGEPAERPDRARMARARSLRRIRDQGVSIVIPVYNALDELRECIASIVEHTTVPARLILVNDASPDPEVRPWLEEVGRQPGLLVLHNEKNKGFSGTVNVGLEAAGRDDVILLNSDTRVTPRWIENLSLAAHSHERVGSVTAMSDNAGVFSVDPPGEAWPEDWSDADIALAVRQGAVPLWPGTPTMHGFCVYLRRDLLDEAGVFDAEAFPKGYGEENDLSMRASYLGWQHIVDDRTFIHHERAASFGESKQALYQVGRAVVDGRYPEYKMLVSRLGGSGELCAIRHRVRVGASRHLAQGDRPRPRVVYVINSRTGGTPQTNEDLMRAVKDRYETLVLWCNSEVIALSRFENGDETELERHNLTRRLELTSHRSAEYDDVVAHWFVKHAVDLVHIRHLAWHSLGLVDLAADLSIPVIHSFHDFYTVCPTIKLLDAEMRYCGGVCTTGEGRCQPELWRAGSAPELRHRWVHNWRRMIGGTLEKCDAFVTTVGSARDTVRRTYPSIADKRFDVILHGRDFTEMSSHARTPAPHEPLRVLVPGNISRAKGAHLIVEIMNLDVDRQIEFHILGAVDSVLKSSPAIMHGTYKRDEFAGRAAEIKPHLGAIFSIWPETYSHTLTELWSAGLPVFAVDQGAVGERIRDTAGGWAVAETSAEALYERLIAIMRAPEDYERVAQKVLDWQTGVGRSYGTPQMAERYMALYADVIAARRGFAGFRTEILNLKEPEPEFEQRLEAQVG